MLPSARQPRAISTGTYVDAAAFRSSPVFFGDLLSILQSHFCVAIASSRSRNVETAAGKDQSRRNAVRHGLTAETVISTLEDADDYRQFEAAVIADYDAQSAVERELVLRLASVLWRLRRAITIETGLFEIQAAHLRDYRQNRPLLSGSRDVTHALFRPAPLWKRGCSFAGRPKYDGNGTRQSRCSLWSLPTAFCG
jgi:hypothetical protein